MFSRSSGAGALIMRAALLGLWVGGRPRLGHAPFACHELTRLSMNPATERWLFLGFFLAFAIKAPFFPFHTWLPDAGGAAPAGAAALLVGVLDKVGTFGILRYCLPLFPNASKYFASLSLPGMSPFVSEFLVLLGTFAVNKAVAVVGVIGVILAAGYALWMVQRTTQGALNPALEKVETMRRDISPREVVVVAPLIALILVLGFYPKPVLDVINPAVQATFSQIGKADPNPTVAQGGGK